MAGLPFAQLPATKTPTNAERGIVRQQPRGVPQPSFKGQDPMRMLSDQYEQEQHQVTQWFNAERQTLLKANLEPKKFDAEYRKLLGQARDMGSRIQATHEAKNLQLQHMDQLVRTGLFTPEQYQQTALVMAGVPAEHVRASFEIPKQRNLIEQLRDVNTAISAVNSRLKGFEDKGKLGFVGGIFKKGKMGARKLYYTDPTTKKERWIKDEGTVARYDSLIGQRDQLFNLQAQLTGQAPDFVRSTMLGQVTAAGRRVPSRKDPTANELVTAAQGKDKETRQRLYQQGVKLGYWK